jgi:hypothetical protein
MTNEYIKFIIFLENTLATFYQKIKNLARLEGARSILEFMEVHSFEHAKIIEGMKEEFPKPVMHENMIADFQNNLLDNVFANISKENDILKVLEMLAGSEESLGKLYESMARLLRKTADYHNMIAAKIEGIASQEFQHSDLLLKDRDRLAKKRPQA